MYRPSAAQIAIWRVPRWLMANRLRIHKAGANSSGPPAQTTSLSSTASIPGNRTQRQTDRGTSILPRSASASRASILRHHRKHCIMHSPESTKQPRGQTLLAPLSAPRPNRNTAAQTWPRDQPSKRPQCITAACNQEILWGWVCSRSSI